MNFEITTEYRTIKTRAIVQESFVDNFAAINGWPYADQITMSEHLIGWSEQGSFDPVAWDDENGVKHTARLLYPGETPSLSIAPTRTWGNLRAF
jgi:hypothetical protein